MANCLRLAASLDWPYTHRPGDSPSCCSASRQGSSVARLHHPGMACLVIHLYICRQAGAWASFPVCFLGCPEACRSDH